jgi:hypothetical protein
VPKFSLQLVFASITLIALGVGFACAVPNSTNPVIQDLALPIWLVAHCAIGAGLLLIFQRPDIGIVLGFVFAWINYALIAWF